MTDKEITRKDLFTLGEMSPRLITPMVFLSKTRYYKRANQILDPLETALTNKKISCKRWGPFNLGVKIKIKNTWVYWSCFCSGFTAYINIHRLTSDGSIDYRCNEKRFINTKTVLDYFDRIRDKEIDPNV